METAAVKVRCHLTAQRVAIGAERSALRCEEKHGIIPYYCIKTTIVAIVSIFLAMSISVESNAAGAPSGQPWLDVWKLGYDKLAGIVGNLNDFQSKHYNRNNNQRATASYAEIVLAGSGFIKYPDSKAIFHQIGRGRSGNEKWVNEKTGAEYVFIVERDGVIFDPPVLETSDVNRGTFNFAPASDFAGHTALDILPWILFGNSPSDSSTFEFRIKLAVMGLGDQVLESPILATLATAAGLDIGNVAVSTIRQFGESCGCVDGEVVISPDFIPHEPPNDRPPIVTPTPTPTPTPVSNYQGLISLTAPGFTAEKNITTGNNGSDPIINGASNTFQVICCDVSSPGITTTSADHLSGYQYTSWGRWSGSVLYTPSNTTVTQGLWVAGPQTPRSDLPTSGSASYAGSVRGDWTNGSTVTRDALSGSINMVANFGASTVNGSMNIVRNGQAGTWAAPTFNVPISSGQSTFNGSMSNVQFGAIVGQFYGPASASSAPRERGGAWTVVTTTNGAGSGVFRASR